MLLLVRLEFTLINCKCEPFTPVTKLVQCTFEVLGSAATSFTPPKTRSSYIQNAKKRHDTSGRLCCIAQKFRVRQTMCTDICQVLGCKRPSLLHAASRRGPDMRLDKGRAVPWPRCSNIFKPPRLLRFHDRTSSDLNAKSRSAMLAC